MKRPTCFVAFARFASTYWKYASAHRL